jgi:hypothetical protein
VQLPVAMSSQKAADADASAYVGSF